MTTRLRWLPTLALCAPLSGCVLAKSVGDDPMMGDTDGATSSGGMDSATSQGPGSASVSSSAGSASSGGNTSTTGGGNASATSGGFPGPEACGIEPVPDGLPGYMYSLGCEGGCFFEYVVPLPLDDFDAISECLCESAGCGTPNGEVGEGGGGPGGTDSYEGVCDIEIIPNDGPGYYEAICDCQTCAVHFEDIHPDSLDALFADETICDCLCLEAGCGYSEGLGGGVEGGETGDPDGATTTGA